MEYNTDYKLLTAQLEALTQEIHRNAEQTRERLKETFTF